MDRGEDRGAGGVAGLGARRLVGGTQRLDRARGLQFAKPLGGRRPDHEVRRGQARAQHGFGIGRLGGDERRHHRRQHAIVAILEHQLQARHAGARGQGAERRRLGHTHGPVRVGVEPGQREREILGRHTRQGTGGLGPHERQALEQEVDQAFLGTLVRQGGKRHDALAAERFVQGGVQSSCGTAAARRPRRPSWPAPGSPGSPRRDRPCAPAPACAVAV